MKVFITGGSGMVGRNLKEYLEFNSDFEILAPTSKQLNLTEFSEIKNYLKSNKPNIIVHCAGIVGGIQSNISKPFTYLNLNTQIGLNLINASIETGVKRFINLGSSCMYPKGIIGKLDENQILNGKLEPTNEGYALAKIVSSKLCEFAQKEYGFNFKTIIPCNLYGKYDKFDPLVSHLIPAIFLKIYNSKKNNTSVEIWGDGNARREFMYVEDLADFIFFAIKNYNQLDAYTNVGLGYDYSVLDYYKKISSIVGYTGVFEFNKNKPEGMKRKLLSVKKQEVLGWKPKHTLNDGLRKTNDFFYNNIWNIS